MSEAPRSTAKLPRLQLRIMLLVMPATWAVALVLSAIYFSTTYYGLKSYLRVQDQYAVENLADVVSVALRERNYPQIVSLIDGAARANDLAYVWVTSPEGQIIVCTDRMQTREHIAERYREADGFAMRPLGSLGSVHILPSVTILSDARNRMLTSAIVGILAVVPLVGLAVRLSHQLADPISRISSVADRVAAGNLAAAQDEVAALLAEGRRKGLKAVVRVRETGQLLIAMKTMTQNLTGLIGQIQASGTELTATATELAATSNQQEQVGRDFGASASEIAAAVSQISATSQELLNTMDQVGQVAGSSSQMATAGQSSLAGMEQTMRHLADSSGTISSKLSVISERASEINMVVTTITKVADQTNLLSINAAIEAEKAGEAGLGFMVVAQEIRRLADQTAQATLDIEHMVRQMQGAVSTGVMEMDKFSEQVRRGVHDVARIAGQMGDVLGGVQTLSQRFDTVTDGMRSQSAGAMQISDAMLQLRDAAQRTGSSLREFKAASENLRTAVDNIKQELARFRTAAR